MTPLSGQQADGADGAAALLGVSWRGGRENRHATRPGRAAVAQDAVIRVLAGGGR